VVSKIKKENPKVKKYFDIKLECLVPTVIVYRVLAEDENEALAEFNKKAPIKVNPDIRRKRPIKATVYDGGCTTVRATKNYKV
jgi:hypothetical protein